MEGGGGGGDLNPPPLEQTYGKKLARGDESINQ